MKTIKKNLVLESPHGKKPFLADICYPENSEGRLPVVVFAHGFKGHKDWGAFNLVSEAFAKAGFVYCKLNFSRNGTTLEKPSEFADLEAFGNNNFEIELDDLKTVFDFMESSDAAPIPMDLERLYLIGHSRGGSTAILKAAEDPRVKKIAVWAAMSDLKFRMDQAAIDEWRKSGVQWIWNARTQQNMPVYFQIYENFMKNPARYDVAAAAAKLQIPMLAFHGTADPTLPVAMAYALQKAKPDLVLEIMEGADHVFGATEPYLADDMPLDLQTVVSKSIAFFNETN